MRDVGGPVRNQKARSDIRAQMGRSQSEKKGARSEIGGHTVKCGGMELGVTARKRAQIAFFHLDI